MYLDLNKPIQYDFGGYKRFVKGEKHVMRVCRHDVLILMLGGTLYFNEAGQPVEVRAGEYYIQKSGILQEGIVPSNDAYYIWLHFFGEFTEIGTPFSLPMRGQFDIEKIYRSADKLCRAERNHSDSYTHRSVLFLEILSLLSESNRSTGETTLLAESLHSYISEHCTESVRISDLARKFSYSEDYLIRVFRRHYGMTPHKYLTICRIDLAKILLATTDRSITDIASHCGFSDFTAFWRAFSSHTGVSPQKWRTTQIGF